MKKRITSLLVIVSFLFSPFVWAQSSGSSQKLSESQLEKLVAPIALYPDPLLAQILPASTYPLEIVDAARVIKNNSDVSKIDAQNWDPSVKAVAHYPSVLKMMNDKLDWTQQLGQAVMTQQSDVLQAIQNLRQQAKKAGNLKSTPQQNVQETNNTIAIVPSDPQVIYVPTYNPTVVYAAPDPMYGFGAGFMMGAWMSMGFAWGGAWGGGTIVNNYNWNNINSNNVKNWENQHPNATQDAKNAWSHDNSRGSPFGGGGGNDYSKPGSVFSKGDSADSNYKNFENQMSNLKQQDNANKSAMNSPDKNDFGNRGNSDNRSGSGNRGDDNSMFGGRGDGDRATSDSMRGFDSRGGDGGFGSFRGFGGGGGGFGGFHGGGRR